MDMKIDEVKEQLEEPEKRKKLFSDAKMVVKPVLITLGVLCFLGAIVFSVILLTPKEDLSQFLAYWKEVVETGDEQAYAKICSQEFKNDHKDLYEDARDLMTGQSIKVSIDDKNITEIPIDDNHYAIKHIPVVLSKNGTKTHKELIVGRRGLLRRGWQVEREKLNFSKAEEEKLKEIVVAKPREVSEKTDETPLDTQFRIRQTLEVWRTSWEKKDLDKYMDIYADYARITRVTVINGKEKRTKLTKSELRKHMEKLDKNYRRIQVKFSEPVEIRGDLAVAKAKFLQEYTAWGNSSKKPVYRDLGTKQLQFVKHNKEWKITDENWTVYENVPIYPKRES